MLIDSHCHLNMLDLSAYENDLDKLIADAKAQGVAHILCISVDLASAPEVIAIAQRYENVSASVGIHPSEKGELAATDEAIIALADHPKVVAIGEMGLDYYYNESGHDEMQRQFRQQIRIAHQLKKPIIIHSRAAHEDTIRIMKEENARDVGGVMHCFTESLEMAQQAMELGFFISFSGIVTFKNAKNVQAVAREIPLEKMLIETDAPYLTPTPYRGKPNRPQYVQYVAQKIAQLHDVSDDEVVRVTGENFIRLFGDIVK